MRKANQYGMLSRDGTIMLDQLIRGRRMSTLDVTAWRMDTAMYLVALVRVSGLTHPVDSGAEFRKWRNRAFNRDALCYFVHSRSWDNCLTSGRRVAGKEKSLEPDSLKWMSIECFPKCEVTQNRTISFTLDITPPAPASSSISFSSKWGGIGRNRSFPSPSPFSSSLPALTKPSVSFPDCLA